MKNGTHKEGNAGATSAASARSTMLQEKALQARLRGLSCAAIAAEIGCSKTQAHRLLVKALAGARATIAAAADEALAVDLLRLDAMWPENFTRAQAGDVAAVHACMRIMERRARLLGLDAAQKRELSGPDGQPLPLVPPVIQFVRREEFAEIAAELVRAV
jgi:hypothetical protein